MGEIKTYKATTSKYRPEIDGLRAIAVAAVFIFHLNKNLLPGGYWGVDIFFVISGYVVFLATSLRNTKKDSLALFYRRRIKRIIPAALICVVLSTILSIILIPPNSWTIDDAPWALIGAQNLALYLSSDNYFGVGADNNIFLQFWSLGIEEQFYVAFPILWYIFSKRNARKFIIASAFLFVFSFGWWSISNIFNTEPKSALFFLPQFRAWELMTGVFLAYALHHQTLIKTFMEKIRIKIRSTSSLLLDIFIVVFLGYAFLNISDNYSTNFLSTTAVCLATLAILWSTYFEKNSYLFRFLSCRPLVWIGKRSYGIYLYHWMTIVILKNTIGDNSLIFYVLAIAFTSVFTIVSWHLVEKPFASQDTKISIPCSSIRLSSVTALLIGNLLLALSAPLLTKTTRKIPNYDWYNAFIFSIFDIKTSSSKKTNISWEANAKSCHHKHVALNKSDLVRKCLEDNLPTSRSNAFYLLGDSHAQSLIPMVHKALDITPDLRDYTAKNVHIDAFSSIIDGDKPEDFEYVKLNSKPQDIILLNWYSGKFLDLNPIQYSNIQNYIQNFITSATSNGAYVVLIRDNPTLRTPIRIDRCIFQDRIGLNNSCSIEKRLVLERRSKQDKFWDQILDNSENSRVRVYDTSDDMCKSSFCDYKDSAGNIVMVDHNHLSSFEAERQGIMFSRFVSKIFSKD